MSSVDLSDFLALSKPKRKLCPIGAALGELDATAGAQLQAACAQDIGIITGSAIGQWLKARGIEANPNQIASHRRGTCTCHDA